MKRFSVKENSFKGTPATTFIEGSVQIAGSEDCIAAVSQPTAKELLGTWRKLLQVTDRGHTYTFVKDPKIYSFLKHLYAELAHMKLDIIIDLPTEDFAKVE